MFQFKKGKQGIVNTGIYIRVSTEEQAKEGFSINAQKDKLTKYAEVNDWRIYDYYIDDGISGKNIKGRPEVNRLLNDLKKGVIKNILVYKLDRLTRSVADLISLINLFENYECAFNSQTEKLDTTNAVGRMFVKMLGIFAEFERENLAERVTFGYEQKTKEGNYTNCNGVYGYDYIIKEGILKVNEIEKKYVNKIYNWYLDGYSMTKIANKLSSLKIPTKRNGFWQASTIKSILTNPLYIGRIRYGIKKKNKFEVLGKNITPIITFDCFKNVQKMIGIRKKSYACVDTYYLKALKCFSCGHRYLSKIQIKNSIRYISYGCKNGCKNSFCSHNKIEKIFLEYLDKIADLKSGYNIKDSFKCLNNREKKRFIEIFIKEIVINKQDRKSLITSLKFYSISNIQIN